MTIIYYVIDWIMLSYMYCSLTIFRINAILENVYKNMCSINIYGMEKRHYRGNIFNC